MNELEKKTWLKPELLIIQPQIAHDKGNQTVTAKQIFTENILLENMMPPAIG